MATSYNGYEVISNYGDPRLVLLTANGKKFAPEPGILGGPVGVVMNFLADFLDREVEPMDLTQQLDDWAFEPKTVTGGSGWSCHASATAFDYNALNHPQGASNTWTSVQLSKVDAFLANVLEGCVRWGEHYTYPTKRDGMHYEVMAPINVMIRIADKVSGIKVITPIPVLSPAPTPTPVKDELNMIQVYFVNVAGTIYEANLLSGTKRGLHTTKELEDRRYILSKAGIQTGDWNKLVPVDDPDAFGTTIT